MVCVAHNATFGWSRRRVNFFSDLICCFWYCNITTILSLLILQYRRYGYIPNGPHALLPCISFHECHNPFFHHSLCYVSSYIYSSQIADGHTFRNRRKTSNPNLFVYKQYKVTLTSDVHVKNETCHTDVYRWLCFDIDRKCLPFINGQFTFYSTGKE